MREPIHPGETLREDLDALGMSAAELARRLEVPVSRITEILDRTGEGVATPPGSLADFRSEGAWMPRSDPWPISVVVVGRTGGKSAYALAKA